ncbi:MAG: PEGA domain-containing protein [Candidatus Levybacteria bacterium]|nr:PEGA domain-containing protein [Candidatus Levybacteria bacterium]
MRKLLFYIASFLFLAIGTTVVILYGRGYNFSFGDGKIGISGTGLLAATSHPDGAGIYINNNLTSATNNTINLAPGEYTIKIVKTGYFQWEKKLKIEKEVVSTAYALLIPTAPRLDNITNTGVSDPIVDPSRNKIAYTVSSFTDPRKNGIYILDMSIRPILTLQSASTQIADDTTDTFSKAKLSWSPDTKELMATISADSNTTTTYLLKTSFNQNPQNVTATLASIEAEWTKQREDQERSQLLGLKANLKSLITENFQALAWSGDESKILYTATKSAELPLIISPPMIGANSTQETRKIDQGAVYVYDIKEDKNFKILDSMPEYEGKDFINGFPLTWFPDSKHLIYVNDKKINIMEYDGQNKTTVYAGPFIDNYVFAWPDESKIVMLTDLGNLSISPNLYTIGLK